MASFASRHASSTPLFALLGAATVTGVIFLLSEVITPTRRKKKKNYEDVHRVNNNHNHNLHENLAAPRRYGAVIRLKPEMYRRYRELHDAVWPQVLERMTQSHIRNFTIYYHQETSILFQHFEWIGHLNHVRLQSDPQGGMNDVAVKMSVEEEKKLFDLDMQAIANDPVTRQWWSQCEPCQEPFSQWPGQDAPLLSDGGSGAWWAPLECVAQCGHWPIAYTEQLIDPDFETLMADDSSLPPHQEIEF